MAPLRLMAVVSIVAGAAQVGMAMGCETARAAEPPLLHWSWIWDTDALMGRCGMLEWLHRTCKIANGLSEADRGSVADRWRREGFHPDNIERLIARWEGRAKATAAPTPESCLAASRPAAVARARETCINVRILCFGAPCDPRNPPRSLPVEMLVPIGLQFEDCGYHQRVHERCEIRNGVTRDLRKCAFERLLREGYDPEDVTAIESRWEERYRETDIAKPQLDECTVEGTPQAIAEAVRACIRIWVDCRPEADCEKYKPLRNPQR